MTWKLLIIDYEINICVPGKQLQDFAITKSQATANDMYATIGRLTN